MENYIVSARKYRPSTFRTVVGQHALTATLKNAIATDRLAHAYLFCGSRGVGKTSCARIFAKTINCTHRTPEGEACNECESCRQFNENRSLNIIELDAASHNGIDDMKSLIEQVLVPPTTGRYRVFIIDEVHMLSSAAFNAFLKTLEEPPSYVIFILATTEKHKIIPTILSRCQIYDFSRISVQDIIDHLQYVAQCEGYEAEPEALGVIAERADGAMRDALSVFDQVAASSMGHITYQAALDSLGVLDKTYYAQLVDAFLAGDVRKALLLFNDVRNQGFDPQSFVNGLSQYLRDLVVAIHPSTIVLLEAGDTTKAEMAQRAAACPPDFLYRAMALCNEADLSYRTATNKQFLVELTLIKLCQLQSPSSDNSASDEGQLKPIAHTAAQASATAASSQPQVHAATQAAAQPVQPIATHVQQAAATQVQQQAAATQAQHQANAATQRLAAGPAGQPHIRRMEGMSISIHATDAPKVQQETRKRENAFTQQQLEAAWADWAKANPTYVVLKSTMEKAKPKATGTKWLYSVVVENAVVQGMFHERLDDILHSLRDRLANDMVDLMIEVDETTDPSLRWNTRELFEHELKTHKAFADFVRDFKLRL